MLASKVGWFGLSLSGWLYAAYKNRQNTNEKGSDLGDDQQPDIDRDLFFGSGVPISAYTEAVDKYRRRLQEPGMSFTRGRGGPGQTPSEILKEMAMGGEAEKPETQYSNIKIRIQHGSKQPNNMAEWNEKEKVLNIYYLNGFEPEITNMNHKKLDDGVIQVSLEATLVARLKTKAGLFPLRGFGPHIKPLIHLSALPYRKHPIGHHICKYFVPAIPEDLHEEVKQVEAEGVLPAGYEYGNVPFEHGMCTHPERTKDAQAEITDCDSISNMSTCSVFEKEEGVAVEIKTRSRSTLSGVKVRTFNPYRGAVYNELFDDFGDRFPIETDHNILPDKEDVDGNEGEPRNQSPLLRGKAVVPA